MQDDSRQDQSVAEPGVVFRPNQSAVPTAQPTASSLWSCAPSASSACCYAVVVDPQACPTAMAAIARRPLVSPTNGDDFSRGAENVMPVP